MNPVLRTFLAVVAGTIAAFTFAGMIESIGHQVYPPPKHLDLSDPAQLRTLIESLPLGALLFVLVAWIGATFVGGVVGALLDRTRAVVVSAFVGGFVLAVTIATLVLIPHPAWMSISGVVGIVLAAVASGWLMSRRQSR